MKNKQPATLDWHFFDEGEGEQKWATALAPPDAEATPAPLSRWQRWFARWRYEFFLICSVAACLLWLRFGRSDAATLPITPTPSASPTSQSLTTTYFRFQFAPEQAPAVYAVAARIDNVYKSLSDEWGMGRAPSEPQLRIIVGRPITASRSSATAETLFISADHLTPSDELAPATRLAYYMLRWLIGRHLNKLMQARRIQPVWQPMLMGLQHYFAVPPPITEESPTPENCAWWRALPTLPLDAVLDRDPVRQTWWSDALYLEADEHRIRSAERLTEYLATTYGQEHLLILPQAFSRYDTWEELSPAVFGLPASALAAAWHGYLAEHPKSLLAACEAGYYFMPRR